MSYANEHQGKICFYGNCNDKDSCHGLYIKNKKLKIALQQAINEICRMCRVKNPQHKYCTGCPDINDLNKILKK